MTARSLKLGTLVNIRTGKLDANASSIDGIYPFFTCSKEPLRISSYSFDCECVLVAGNGDLNVKYYNGKFDAYQRTYVIESKNKEVLDSRYLYHFMDRYLITLRHQSIGGIIKYIKLGNLTEALIPIPSVAEQRRIAAILDKAEALRAKRREAIAKLDQLLQSVFLEMFGDPVKNSMGWSSSTLDAHGELKNGINFLKDEVGIKLRYLGVGDFKNKTIFKDIDNLSYISLNENPSEDYLLKDHDILFVRSNGNKQLVGRCMAIFPGNEKITFSGFCIRFRCKSQLLLSSYLVHLFKNSAFKQELLKSGQGANIQNINQKILSTLKIPVPPITQQVKWQEFVEKVESQKYLFEKNISLTEKLTSALHKKFFN